MFDFQKEVVLNSLDSVKKFENSFRVDGMLYKNEYVGPVYKTEAVDGAKAKLVINMADVNSKVTNVMQFVIELGLDNDYRGDFGSVLFYFRKPIVVTMAAGSSVADVAKAFEKAGVVDYKLYNVYTAESKDKPEGVNPGANDIVLVMSDNYITVRKAEVMDLTTVSALTPSWKLCSPSPPPERLLSAFWLTKKKSAAWASPVCRASILSISWAVCAMHRV